MAVTELGSFSRAAAHCRVSQPALSEQIKKLEARMGKVLLNRNHRRIVPTAAGVILIEGANEILAQVENTKQKIRRSDESHIGHVALGILPTVAPFLLTHVLDSFVAQHPNTQVIVHEKVTGQSLELIEAGKLDLGIVSLPVRDNGFETETLFSEEMWLALHPQHPLAQKRTIFTDDLHSEKFILMQEDHSHDDQSMGFSRKQNFRPRIVIHSGQLATVQSLVAAGMGISLIPQMAVPEKPTHITYRQLENPRPKRTLAIVTRNKRPLKLAAQELLKHLRLVGKNFKLPTENNHPPHLSAEPKA